MSRQNDIKRLIIQSNRRLQGLKEKRAQYGLETPVSILTEIEDIETEIEDLQKELTQLEQSSESKKSDHKSKISKDKFRWSRSNKLIVVGIFLALILISTIAVIIVVIRGVSKFIGTSTKAGLEIVDISLKDTIDLISQDAQSSNSYLDIKLRNSGEDVVFIKRVEIIVEDSHLLELFGGCAAGGVEVSEYYDIDLPLESSHSPVVKEISQSISPNDVDRFVIYLQKPFEKVNLQGMFYKNRYRVYQVKVQLQYNTNDMATSENLIFITPALYPTCTFLTEEWLNSDNPPEKFGLTASDTQFFLNLEKIEGKKSDIIQKLVRISKGECYFLSPALESGFMECAGQHIDMYK